ncbi:MAG: peptidase S10, partial [Chloroflexota bacterium]|nr:peptidase S10 [Chloroflexota bacterium]
MPTDAKEDTTVAKQDPPKVVDATLSQDPVRSEHEIQIGRRRLAYDVTTGFLPLVNDKGDLEAHLFFTAYELRASKEQRARRPLMFSFNGGPGSSSVWLHLGALGPRRVRMRDDGMMPPLPFELIDNDQTWLAASDLVFIDPVDTGYSRATTEELAKSFKDVDEDISSIGRFIRLFLTRQKRWTSPLFLVGESYGTFRAAGLSAHLIEQGIAFNGIVLVSSVLDLQTLRFTSGNDLPYILYLPTYAATAWYHKRLTDTVQRRDLRELLREVEVWSLSEYALALAKGNDLRERERKSVVERIRRYTGVDQSFIDESNLRIEIHRFCKELLRGERRTVGRLDSRHLGSDALAVSEFPDFDPSMAAIRPPFTATFNHYVRDELGFETDAEYHILRGLDWNWGNAEAGFAGTAMALQDAFSRNPYQHLFVASGLYDLATPYFATDYTLAHLGVNAPARDRVYVEKYEVGHMVYLESNA